jgi:serine/threonine-protein kinase
LLERYLVDGAFAKGGMAIIYRGHDQRLLRPVCIKVFHRLRPDEVGYRTAYEHFVQEAFALSQFSHPNTLRIYDFGYLEDTGNPPFQISELLEGGTLGQLVRTQGPLPVDEALEILEPVAGALAEAHARGIVHRDIKPSNILFGVAGSRRIVKLCDFGIAKISEEATPNRAEDTFVSAGQRLRLYSPGWCAPEQLQGAPIGASADVFALGLVTAFVLTGAQVFPSVLDAAALEQRAESDAHLARFLGEYAIPPTVADVIKLACRDRVDERYPSIDSFAAALRAAARVAPRPRDRLETEPFALAEHAPPMAEGTPAPERTLGLALPPPPDVELTPSGALAIDPRGDEEVIVAGRRLRMVPIAGLDRLDLGGDGPHLRSAARFRITLNPSGSAALRLNVKGLNCFVARAGARPSTAIDLDADAELHLLAPDRRLLEAMQCRVGVASGDQRLYDLGGATLSVPAASAGVLLDLGPGRELALLHRAARITARAKPDRSIRKR